MPEYHQIEPIFNNDSRILILGSFPSVLSRKSNFYYGHPKNRFWYLLSTILQVPLPTSIEEKKQLLLNNHIALFDVIKSCEISGSSDSSIKKVIPNDLKLIIQNSNIKTIFLNGKTAYNLYQKYLKDQYEIEYFLLPSSSPANAKYTMDKLLADWQKITLYLSDEPRRK